MDVRGFEQAVVALKDRVHAYATRMLRDRAEAQDVAQDALVKLWQHREAVDEAGARLWLMRTAHNLCIDRLRKRKVRSEIADGDDVMDMQPDEKPGPETRAGATEIGAGIETALAELCELDRAVLLMREVHELPYEEIATVLGMPVGTMKARLHRARERLRARLVRVGVRP